MLTRSAVRHYRLVFHRREGLHYRETSCSTAAAASWTAQISPRCRGSDDSINSRSCSSWSHGHCHRSVPPSLSHHPRRRRYSYHPPQLTQLPASYFEASGAPARRFLSTRKGGGVGDADDKEQRQQHDQLSTRNETAPPRSYQATGSRSSSGNSSEIDEDSFVLRMLGPRWSPYGRLARIDKPAGTLLLLFPCWWSIALAAPLHTLPDLKMMGLFATGAFVMR